MACPHFEDYTRMCAEEFDRVINIANFDFCESSDFEQCPFYRLLHKIEPLCPYAEKCPMYFHQTKYNFDGLIEMTNNFCLSSNYQTCARYQLRQSQKEVPVDLYPDGSRISE